jgi:cysteine desulfurase
MAVKLPIYLDHNATTPMDPRVLAAMTPYFTELFGNAASRNHSFGWAAEAAVEKARVQVARLIGATVLTKKEPDGTTAHWPDGSVREEAPEIIWTSGATEGNNLAIKGVAEMYAEKGKHIITQVTEHKAVIDPCKRLERMGYEVTWLQPDKAGRVSVEQVAAAIRPDTILVSIMWANNEIGTIQPVREIGKLCKEKGVLFHTDATQAVGKIPVDVEADGVDLLSFTAHKLYGPKGAGALYVRRKNPRVRLTPIMDGGGHERGFRSGTLNVPGIVGTGAACEIAMKELPTESARLKSLRDRLHKGITDQIDFVTLNGHPDYRLPHVVNLSFAYVEGESMLLSIDDVAVSSGSACTSASLEPSYVLKALGVTEDLAHSSIRFGLGRFTTEAEIDYVVNKLVKAIKRLREMSPLYEMALEGIDPHSVEWTAPSPEAAEHH